MDSIDEFISAGLRRKNDESSIELVSNSLSVFAAEYATRSSERSQSNPFLSRPELVKMLLDSEKEIFERMYLNLGCRTKMQLLIQGDLPSFAKVFVIPDLDSFFVDNYMEVNVRKDKFSFNQLDQKDLMYWFQRSLFENKAHCDEHENYVFEYDRAAGRIWAKGFTNEGRQRAYWLNAPQAPAVFQSLMNDTALHMLAEQSAGSPVTCESLLCEIVEESIFPSTVKNWHIDKLADQIKIMIPLAAVTEDCGPLTWLDNTLPEQLIRANAPHSHIHFSYIYSAMQTTIATFIPNDAPIIQASKVKQAIGEPGDVFILNTRCIHSGSQVVTGARRKTITLTYRVQSLRNNALCSLRSFY
jgi:hypothetical protein